MKGKGPSVEESIRIEAYLLSEKAGHPSGMDAYFWEQAQAIVQARKAAVAGAVKKAASKKPAATKAKAKLKAAPKAEAPKPAAKLAAPPEIKPVAVKAAAKPKAATKPTAKDAQLSLDGSVTAPARKRPPKK